MDCTGWFTAALVCAVAVGAVPREAWADTSTDGRASASYVLAIWTDDADDEADALTQALRARVRQAPGWTLLPSSQSFETLAIALKCPPHPDGPCLQRVGDQLRTNRYVWGTMQRRAGSRDVNVEVHLWARGKPDVMVHETYASGLKDPNDESLRAIAATLFGKLIGAETSTLIVRAGSAGGEVLVDGVERGALSGGIAWIDVTPGPHTVGVRVVGSEAPAQTTQALLGSEQIVAFALTPTHEAPLSAERSEPIAGASSRALLGYSSLVLGAGFLVAAGIEAANWSSDQSDSLNDRKSVPKSVSDVCSDSSSPAALDACSKSRNAVTVSTLGWVFAGVGAALAGTGVWLVAGDPGAKESPSRDAPSTASPAARLEILPALGPRASSMNVRVTF